MADLPKDKFEEAACFAYCAVDMFEPFKVKIKKKEVKHYGAIFTCLESWPVNRSFT